MPDRLTAHGPPLAAHLFEMWTVFGFHSQKNNIENDHCTAINVAGSAPVSVKKR
ncbi:MAG: hypothetical protein ABI977_36170 [Acidobacteriota bacterium]